jgi:transposase-like protein
MKEESFDFEAFKREAIKRLKNKQPLTGKDGVLQPLIKQIIEAALEVEMEEHLTEEEREFGNRKNGKTRKKVKSSKGEFILETPRDRSGTFDPQIVGKRQTLISEEIEYKVLRLYSRGMGVRDICDHIEDMYGFTLSPTTLSTITDRVIPMIKEWQQRPLESHYSFTWMDAMFYKVREDGKVITRALYNIIGVNNQGVKELLGMYISEGESSRFWLQVLEDLKSRGVQDILIACIDNLNGFVEAIKEVFPKTEVQTCIIHQIRNSFKYVSYKDSKAFMEDLRLVYQAINKQVAEDNLDEIESKWGKKYPAVFSSWRRNWENLATFFSYPDDIRKVMYTTNIIEGFHRQVRKITKTKGAFTSDMALLKLVYLATTNIVEKWLVPIANWGTVASQLYIIFGDRANIDINRSTHYHRAK